VLRKCANGDNESIDRIIEGSRMIRNGNPDITGACGRRKIAFDARFFYNHLLRDDRVGVALFDRVTWPNRNFASRPKRLNPCSFGLFNFSLAATDVRPIARRIPTNGKAVDKYVGFLPEIENRDRTMHSRQQKPEVISGKFSAARSVNINQTNGGRRFTIVRLKRIISRSKISRQSAGKR